MRLPGETVCIDFDFPLALFPPRLPCLAFKHGLKSAEAIYLFFSRDIFGGQGRVSVGTSFVSAFGCGVSRNERRHNV